LVSQLEPSGTNWIKTKEKFPSRENIRKWKTGLKEITHVYSSHDIPALVQGDSTNFLDGYEETGLRSLPGELF
jgi:hypothetical protein